LEKEAVLEETMSFGAVDMEEESGAAEIWRR